MSTVAAVAAESLVARMTVLLWVAVKGQALEAPEVLEVLALGVPEVLKEDLVALAVLEVLAVLEAPHRVDLGAGKEAKVPLRWSLNGE